MKADVPEPAVLVAMRGIVKDFPGVRANDGVDFELRRRRGPRAPRRERRRQDDAHERPRRASTARTRARSRSAGDDGPASLAAGTPSTAESAWCTSTSASSSRFTVAENVTLGWHTPRALIRRAAARAGDRPPRRGVPDPRRPRTGRSGSCPSASSSGWRSSRTSTAARDVLILDEPTAVLTPQEADGALRRACGAWPSEGRGIVFITHKLDEVMAVADRVTVLRGGRNVATRRRARETTPAGARAADDRPRARPRPPREPARPRETPVLRLEALEADDERGIRVLRGVDLEVRAGEILGLAGVAGNGQRAARRGRRRAPASPRRAGRSSRHGHHALADPAPDRRRHRLRARGPAPPGRRARRSRIADNLIAKSYRAPAGRGPLPARPASARRRWPRSS